MVPTFVNCPPGEPLAVDTMHMGLQGAGFARCRIVNVMERDRLELEWYGRQFAHCTRVQGGHPGQAGPWAGGQDGPACCSHVFFHAANKEQHKYGFVCILFLASFALQASRSHLKPAVALLHHEILPASPDRQQLRLRAHQLQAP